MAKTSLYRHFDAQGRLLYVGVALDFLARTRMHQSKSHWFFDIARITVEHHPTRAHALYAEAIAIRIESPLHNRAKPNPIEPIDAGEWLEEDDDPEDVPVHQVRAPLYFTADLPCKDGVYTAVYTVLQDGVDAQEAVNRIAASLSDIKGFVVADVANPGHGRGYALGFAQNVNVPIVTDRAELFAKYQDWGISVSERLL